MDRFGFMAGAAILVLTSLSAVAQQPAPPTHAAPPAGQQQQMPMEREHGMAQGTQQGQGPGSGTGMGGMGQGGSQRQGGMGMGGMGGMGKDGMMEHMHQGQAAPPSSAHSPSPQGATTPQCPSGTAIQMDEKGQHSCK